MITFSKEFFNIEDSLFCGQLFRFFPYEKGYMVLSLDKACYLYYENENVVLESNDDDYFYNYFDLERDYSKIYDYSLSQNIDFLSEATKQGKGIRIFKQDKFETLFSFVVSQNNNIPRIKRTIEGLSCDLGDKKKFLNFEYFAFPTENKLKECSEEFYKQHGLGYRASYFVSIASTLADGKFMIETQNCSYENLKIKLLSLKGVGNKVADCVLLFGYNMTNSFPVDTWIEKIYRENFNGELTDRQQIALYFTSTFKEYSGFIQQYLFYYKRGK